MLVSRNGQAYVNDLNGNTLSGGGRTNTWDSQNRLVQCVSGGNTSQFVYGADGLRRTSIVNGNPVHSVLDSSMMVREMVPSGQTLIPKATYLIGPRGPEYRYDHQTQAIRWYLYDGLGSVLAEIDALGNMTTPRQYDVYGLVRAGDNGTSRHKYVGSLGHTSEDETGLIYMRARWMDPSLGRFISEDPARDGANWFEYCRGNPVNAVDSDGKRALPVDNFVAFCIGWFASTSAVAQAALGNYFMAGLLAKSAFLCFAYAAIGMLPMGLDKLNFAASLVVAKWVSASLDAMVVGSGALARMPGGMKAAIAALGYGITVTAFIVAANPDAFGTAPASVWEGWRMW